MISDAKNMPVLKAKHRTFRQSALRIYLLMSAKFLGQIWWKQVLAFGLLSTVYIFIAGWLGAHWLPAIRGWGQGVPPTLQVAPNDLSALFARWDSFYYLEIANQGYGDQSSARAFFPLYSLVTRGINYLLGIPLLWTGLFISLVSFLGAGLAMYKWLRADYAHELSLISTLFMYIFPVSFFFVGFYAEPLFLFLATLGLALARYGRFGASGVAIALAGATRPQAFLLAIPYCLEFRKQGSFSRRDWLHFGAGAVIAPLGTLAYAVFLSQESFHDAPLVYTGLIMRDWNTYLAPPWTTLIDGLGAALMGINIQPDWFSRAVTLHDTAYALLGLVLAVWAIGRLRLSTAAFLLSSILFFFTVHGEYGYAFDSMPRHVASLPPIFLCMALLHKRLPVRLKWILPGVSVIMLGILAAWFASGRWIS